ncbi:MAG: CTP synthase [candidate division Zixibacteria bacterium]|nr:CTP synthase [candidate division Zixibacteria bacterium]
MSRTAKQPKFIFITGGVTSSLGKGIAAGSIGLLLKSRGLNVMLQKFDPYINVDPGTMNPFQHGEVFVLDDGSETDLDLGHYERFIDVDLNRLCNVTSGQVYDAVIQRERRGDYLGATVQVIPHITDEIKSRCTRLARQYENVDIIITEIGGTVGDIESLPFMEAIRQMGLDYGRENTLYIHLTLVPYLKTSDELKTKPTQHSVKMLREIGIQPDILICRSIKELSRDIKKKIALFCNVPPEAVIQDLDCSTIYEVPILFHHELVDNLVVHYLKLLCKDLDLTEWKEMVHKINNPKHTVRIAICGKYINLKDAYKSINEAFIHGGIANDTQVELVWVSSEEIAEESAEKYLGNVDGVLIPGGFGDRGIEGKIAAIKYVRENKIPFLGLCLGLHCAIIEYARNVCGFNGADSYEFNQETKYPVIHLMDEQRQVTNMGGTMRLGSYPCVIKKGSVAAKIYGKLKINERHRHRYEVNNEYRDELGKKGMRFPGLSPDEKLVEMIELPDHPFFVGCQFHPELKSRPMSPHPLFKGFIEAALNYRKACEVSTGTVSDTTILKEQ